jgi:Mg2+-importing ATPase
VFLSLRSLLPISKAGFPSPIIIAMSLFAIILSSAMIYFPLTIKTFGFLPLSFSQILTIASLLVFYLITNEIVKKIYSRFWSPIKWTLME